MKWKTLKWMRIVQIILSFGKSLKVYSRLPRLSLVLPGHLTIATLCIRVQFRLAAMNKTTSHRQTFYDKREIYLLNNE